MAKKPKTQEHQPSELENALAKVFSDTWPVSRNFREKIRPIIEPLLKQIEDLKKENADANMAMFNILGEGGGADWSSEPTEAKIAELRTWADKFHEMKAMLSNDGFVPFSRGDKGYPFMAVDQYGRGKLLLAIPQTGSESIYPQGMDAPDNHPPFVKEALRFEDMSPTGRLVIRRQDDGDICIQVIDAEGRSTGVEFCTSGGKSPRTRRALSALMIAMRDDEPDPRLGKKEAQ
jgi:hypothetical protein